MNANLPSSLKRAVRCLPVTLFALVVLGGFAAITTNSKITEADQFCPVVNTLKTTEVGSPDSLQVGIQCRKAHYEIFYVRTSGKNLQPPKHGTLYNCRVKLFSSFGSDPDVSEVLRCTPPKV